MHRCKQASTLHFHVGNVSLKPGYLKEYSSPFCCTAVNVSLFFHGHLPILTLRINISPSLYILASSENFIWFYTI